MEAKTKPNLENWQKQYNELDSQTQKASLLLTKWYAIARDKQLIKDEDDYNIQLFLAGRGFGKTLTLSYDATIYCLLNPNSIVGVVAPTYSDLKKIIFQGESGFLSIIDRELLSNSGYNKTDNQIEFTNGSKIIGYPAIEPDRLRGNNFHRAYCDELASWRYATETFDNLMMALRLGESPKCIITTTPRPIELIKQLVVRADTKVIKGNTFENAENLAPSTIKMLKERYSGTRIGQQELYGQILEDIEGALFNATNIEKNRVELAPELTRVVVAVDPAVTSNKNISGKRDSDETGIIVAGRGVDNHYYILGDYSGIFSPDMWIKKAIECYYKWEADFIVAETNQGGDLIEKLLRVQDANVPYKGVHAKRGKVLRAEPVSSIFEQDKAHMVGYFKELEEQMCSFTPYTVKSPDRLDACVYAISSLQNSGSAIFRIS